MQLSNDQIAEAHRRSRVETLAGRPEIASLIRRAAERGEVYEDPEVVVKPVVPQPSFHGPGSSKKAWIEYAKQVSDIDDEVLEVLGQEDIVAMLRANGLVPMPKVDKFIEVNESEDDE